MSNNYIGKAGQLFAMSEFLMLGWNVAIPEVDRGDDIFVVRDENGELRRVQVKTSAAKSLKGGYSTQFNVPYSQLRAAVFPELHFLFLIRYDNRWSDLIMIRRDDLANELEKRLRKTDHKSSKLTLRFVINKDKILCGKVDFSAYRHLASRFPKIYH